MLATREAPRCRDRKRNLWRCRRSAGHQPASDACREVIVNFLLASALSKVSLAGLAHEPDEAIAPPIRQRLERMYQQQGAPSF